MARTSPGLWPPSPTRGGTEPPLWRMATRVWRLWLASLVGERPGERAIDKATGYASNAMTSVWRGSPVTSIPLGSSSTSTSVRSPRCSSGR